MEDLTWPSGKKDEDLLSHLRSDEGTSPRSGSSPPERRTFLSAAANPAVLRGIERINVYGYLLWIAVLAIALLRAEKTHQTLS
jgi:hypothetical protein